MPTIRRYVREEKIGSLPRGTMSAAQTALSEGAGVEEARADKLRSFAESAGIVGRIGTSIYADIVAKERHEANVTQALEIDNGFAEWKNRYLYDQQNGALLKKGKNAMNLPKEALEEFDRTAGELEKLATNPEQRAQFAKIRANYRQGVDLEIQRHVAGEVMEHQNQTLEAKIALGTAAAIQHATDPTMLESNLKSVDDAIDAMSSALGWSPEKVTARKAKEHSDVHVEAISQLIAGGRTEEAKEWFTAKKGEIDGSLYDAIETKLKDGDDLKQAQAQAAAIVSQPGTLTQHREEAKKIADPEQQEKALAIIEHEHAIKRQEKLNAERENLRTVYNRIDAGERNIASWMRSKEWQDMDPGERASAEEYIQRRIKGWPTTTNIAKKLELYEMVRDDPEKFAGLKLLNYRNDLSDSDLEELARTQVNITQGKTREAAKDITGLLSVESVLRNTMGSRYDPKKKESQELLVALNAKYEEAQQRTGKKMTDTELQETADYLWQDVVVKEGTWKALVPWRGTMWYPVGADERFADTTKPVRDLTISDIPAGEQQSISNALRGAGKTPTPDLVLQEWVRAKKRLGQVRQP
jgi:hypothetical protein